MSLERQTPTIFLTEPMPERICQMSFLPDFKPKKPFLMLSVGLHILTEDHSGLKMVPTTQIAIAIGEVSGDTEKTFFDLDVRNARAIAQRMIEMCDAADAANGGD